LKALGEEVPGFKLREAMEPVDKNRDGKVEFDEFLRVNLIFCTKH